MKQILVVEDDRDIADLLVHHLGRAGYATDIIADGGSVMKRVRQRTPDLIVLDLMLPRHHANSEGRRDRSDRWA